MTNNKCLMINKKLKNILKMLHFIQVKNNINEYIDIILHFRNILCKNTILNIFYNLF